MDATGKGAASLIKLEGSPVLFPSAAAMSSSSSAPAAAAAAASSYPYPPPSALVAARQLASDEFDYALLTSVFPKAFNSNNANNNASISPMQQGPMLPSKEEVSTPLSALDSGMLFNDPFPNVVPPNDLIREDCWTGFLANISDDNPDSSLPSTPDSIIDCGAALEFICPPSPHHPSSAAKPTVPTVTTNNNTRNNNNKHSITHEDDDLERVKRRRRESAQRARARKTAYMRSLEQENMLLRNENRGLREAITKYEPRPDISLPPPTKPAVRASPKRNPNTASSSAAATTTTTTTSHHHS
eukprot:jgi/Chlat1/1026/Chrsp109S01450